jgi:hypothetical protein
MLYLQQQRNNNAAASAATFVFLCGEIVIADRLNC